MSEGSERKGINGRLRPRKPNTTYVHQLRNLRKSEQLKLEESRPTSPEIQTPKIEDIFLPNPSSAAKHLVEHGKQPYLCLFCDRQFPLRQSLCKHMQRVHQRTSRRENNIRCPYCAQKEANVDKLFPHLVEYHASQYFACLTCFVRFSSATDLCHHLQTICSLHKLQTTSFLSVDIDSNDRIPVNSLPKIHKRKKSRKAESEASTVEKETTHNLRSNSTGQDLVTATISENEKSDTINNLQLDKNLIIILDDNSQLHNETATSTNDSNAKELLLSGLGIGLMPQSHIEVDRDSPTEDFLGASKCFDDDFYSKVANNVHDNLTNYLDGTLTNLPFPNSTEVDLKECESLTVNSIDGFPTLLAVEQYAKGTEDLLQRRPILKHKWKTDSTDSDRHGEYDKQIDTLKNNGGHLPQCILPLISGLDIWTQIQMRKKYDDILLNELTDINNRKNDHLRKVKKTGKEKKNENPSLMKASGFDECRQTKLTDLDQNNFSLLLGLQHTQSKYETTPALLSGEWARPRCYVCCACGYRTEDPRSLSSHDSTYHPFTQSSHYEVVGKDLLDADILKHLYVPKSQILKRSRPPRGTHICTKCGKAVTADELHPHILECAGDTQVVRRKNRNRPFGVRKRRSRVADEDAQNRRMQNRRARKRARRNKRERLNHLSLQPRVRTEVGDAETIKKMLENLPAKRHHRASSTQENASNGQKVRKSDISTMYKKRQAAKLDRNKRNAIVFKQKDVKIHDKSACLQETDKISIKSADFSDNLPSTKARGQIVCTESIPNKSAILNVESTDPVTSESSGLEIVLTNEILCVSHSLQMQSTEVKIGFESTSFQDKSAVVRIPFASGSQVAESADVKIPIQGGKLQMMSTPNVTCKDSYLLMTETSKETSLVIEHDIKPYNVETTCSENGEINNGESLEISNSDLIKDNINVITHNQEISPTSDKNEFTEKLSPNISNTETSGDVESCNNINKTTINNNFEKSIGDTGFAISNTVAGSKNMKPPQLFKPYIDLLDKEPEKQCVTSVQATSPKMAQSINSDVTKLQPTIMPADRPKSRPHKPKRCLDECIALLIQGKLSDASDPFTGEQTAPMDLSTGRRDATSILPMKIASIATSPHNKHEPLGFCTQNLNELLTPPALKNRENSNSLSMTKRLSPDRRNTYTSMSPEFKNTVGTNTFTQNVTNELQLQDNYCNTDRLKAQTREMATNTMGETEETPDSKNVGIAKNITSQDIGPIIVESCASESSKANTVDILCREIHGSQPAQAGNSHNAASISSEDSIESCIKVPKNRENRTFSLHEPLQSHQIESLQSKNGTASLRAVRIKSTSDKQRIVATSKETSTTGMSPEKQNGINYITEKLKDVETTEIGDLCTSDDQSGDPKPSSVKQSISEEINTKHIYKCTVEPSEQLPKGDEETAQAIEESTVIIKEKTIDLGEFHNHEKMSLSTNIPQIEVNDINKETVISEIVCKSTDNGETEIIIKDIKTSNEPDIPNMQCLSLTLPTDSKHMEKTDLENSVNSSMEMKKMSTDCNEVCDVTSPLIELSTSSSPSSVCTALVNIATDLYISPLLQDNKPTSTSKLNDIIEASTEITSKTEPLVKESSEDTEKTQNNYVLTSNNDNLSVSLATCENEDKYKNIGQHFDGNQSLKELSIETNKTDDNIFKEIYNDDTSGESNFTSMENKTKKQHEHEIFDVTNTSSKPYVATEYRPPTTDTSIKKRANKKIKKTITPLHKSTVQLKKEVLSVCSVSKGIDDKVLNLNNHKQNDTTIALLEKNPVNSDSDDNLPLSIMVGKRPISRNKSKDIKSKIEKNRKIGNRVDKSRLQSKKTRRKLARGSRTSNTPIVVVDNMHKDDTTKAVTEEINETSESISVTFQINTELQTEHDVIKNEVQICDTKPEDDLSIIIEKTNLLTEEKTDKEVTIDNTKNVTTLSTNEESIKPLQSTNTESFDLEISTSQKRKSEVCSPAQGKKKPRRRRQNIFREPKRYKKKPTKILITTEDTSSEPNKKLDTGISKECLKTIMPTISTAVSDENFQPNTKVAKLNTTRRTRVLKRRKYFSKCESSSEARSTSQDTVQSDSQSQDSIYNVKSLNEVSIGSESVVKLIQDRRLTRARKVSIDSHKIQSEADLKLDIEQTPALMDLWLDDSSQTTQSNNINQPESQEKECLLPEKSTDNSDSSSRSDKKRRKKSVVGKSVEQKTTQQDDKTESEEESINLRQLAEKKAEKRKTDFMLTSCTQKSTDNESSSEPDFTKYSPSKVQANQRDSSKTNTGSRLKNTTLSTVINKPIPDKELTSPDFKPLHSDKKVELHQYNTITEELVQHSSFQSIQPTGDIENKIIITNSESSELTQNSTEEAKSNDGKPIDTYFENFGFFGQRQPRKSNLLASKKIHETFKANAEDESTQSASTDAESIKFKRKRGAPHIRKAIRSKNIRGNNRVGIKIPRVIKDKVESSSSQSGSESSASLPAIEVKRLKKASTISDDHKQILPQENTRIYQDIQDVNVSVISDKANDDSTPPELIQNVSNFTPYTAADAVIKPAEPGSPQGSETKKIIKVGGKELTCDEAFFYEVCGLLRNAEGKQAVRLVCGKIITLDDSDPKNIVISFDPPSNDQQSTNSNIIGLSESLGSETNQDMSAEDLEQSVIKTLMQNRALMKKYTDHEPASVQVEDKEESKAINPALPHIFEDKFDIIKRKSSARSASAVATGRSTSSSSGSRIAGNGVARSVTRTPTSSVRNSTSSNTRNLTGSNNSSNIRLSTGTNVRAATRSSNAAIAQTTQIADACEPSIEAVINTSYSEVQNISKLPEIEIVSKSIENDQVKTIIADILNQPTLIDDIARVPTKAARKGFRKGRQKCPFISRTHKHSLCKQRLRLFFAYRRKLATDSITVKGMLHPSSSSSTSNPFDVYDFSDSEDVEEFDCITMAQINKIFDALNKTGADNNYYTEETDSEEDFIYTPGHVYNKKRYGVMSVGSLRCSQQNTYPEKSAVVGKIFKNVAHDSRKDKLVTDKEGKRKVGKKKVKDGKTQDFNDNVEKSTEDKGKDRNNSSEEKTTLDELFDSLLVTTPATTSLDLVDNSLSIEEHNANQSSDYSDSNAVAPIEPELGVARQRTRRKCAVGKQNVLAETWSSESEVETQYSNYHSTRRKKTNRQTVAVVATPQPPQSQHVRDLVEASTSTSSNPTARREGGVFRPAYSLSSSEDDEPHPLVQQHGWIVGNSHKKLVTMLAHAKGRKKEANKKRRDKEKDEDYDKE